MHGPSLSSLVPGSLTARTLARVWRDDELYFEMPIKNADVALELMADVAMQLAMRVGAKVVMLLESEGRVNQMGRLLWARSIFNQMLSGGRVDCTVSLPVADFRGHGGSSWYNVSMRYQKGLVCVKFHADEPWRHEIPLDVALAGAA
jgi:hypothetical protein